MAEIATLGQLGSVANPAVQEVPREPRLVEPHLRFMTSVHPITRVTEDDIGRLGPVELVEFTHQLLFCEARRLGFARPEIYSTTRITIADGGRDLGWENPLQEAVAYIPRAKTFYQSKATGLSEAAIKNELLNSSKDALKPRVAEVLLHGGAYVFVTTDSWVKRSDKKDIRAIANEAVASVGADIHPDSLVAVLGREKLAQWANNYPSVVAYVLRVTRSFPLVHLFDVRAWGQTPEIESNYVRTPRLEKILEALRSKLLGNAGEVFRLTGLSGLGKTNLVYQAVTRRDENDIAGAFLQASAVFLNYSDHAGAALNLLLGLADGGFEGIVIVDDCPPREHQNIKRRVAGRRLTVLTLYHEPEKSDEHSLLLTPEDNKDLVHEILRSDQRSTVIPPAQLKRMADFGDGFPVIARMMLDQGLVPTDRLLIEEDIGIKLLGDGITRDQKSEELYAAHCLFRRIGGDERRLREQTNFLEREFASGISPAELQMQRERLERRGLLKTIGDVRLPVPRPLAVAFAIRALGWTSPEEWPAKLARIEEADLLRSFCQRIGEFEFSERSAEVGKRLCEIFPFGNIRFLANSGGGALFREVTLLNPSWALSAAQSAMNCPAEELNGRGEGHGDLLHGLERIAWHPDHYLAAAALILRLATLGPESVRLNALESFVNFHNLALSGTRKAASERLTLLRDVLGRGDDVECRVAILALRATLNYGSFTRSGDGSLTGIRDPERDWYPATLREVGDYHKQGFLMLAGVCLNSDALADAAWDALETGLGSILRLRPLIDELDDSFRALAETKAGLWPAAKSAIRSIFETDGSDLLPVHRQALERWMDYVTPKPGNFEGRYHDIVGNPGYHHLEDPSGNYIDVSGKEAEAFAKEAVSEGIDLLRHSDVMLLRPQQEAYRFGKTLAQCYSLIDALVEILLEAWQSLDEESRDRAILLGIAAGLAGDREKREVLLNRVATTPQLESLLIGLSCASKLEIADVRRIRKALLDDKASPREFIVLSGGGVTDELNPQQFVTELTLILDGKPEAAAPILKVLLMYCHRRPDRFKAVSALFMRLLVHQEFSRFDTKLRYDWKSSAIQLVHLETNPQRYEQLARWIFSVVQTHQTYKLGGELADVLRAMLARAPEVVVRIIYETLNHLDDRKLSQVGRFLTNANAWRDESGSPLWDLDDSAFSEWLRRHPKLTRIVLGHMPLFVPTSRSTGTPNTSEDASEASRSLYQWRPHTRLLLEAGVSSDDLCRALCSRFLLFGSTGSRVPHLEERKRNAEDLISSDDTRLVDVAREVIRILDAEIERERRQDLNDEAEYM